DAGIPQGLVTKSDYLAYVAGDSFDPHKTLAKDIMTPADKLICVTPKDTVAHCLFVLSHHRFSHLPERDGKGGQIIAMGTYCDIIECVLKEAVERTDQLQRFIRGC